MENSFALQIFAGAKRLKINKYVYLNITHTIVPVPELHELSTSNGL